MVSNSEDLFNNTYFMPNGKRRREVTKLIKDKQFEIEDGLSKLNKELSAAKRIKRGGIEKDINGLDIFLSSQLNLKEVDDTLQQTIFLVKDENISILGNHQKSILQDLQERLETLSSKERLDVFKSVEKLKERSKDLLKTDIYVNRLEKRKLELMNDLERLKKLPNKIDTDIKVKAKYEKVKEIHKNLDLDIREREILATQRLERFNEFLNLDKEVKGFIQKQFPKIEKEMNDTLTYINKNLGKDILKEENNTEKALNTLFAQFLKKERLLKDMQLAEGVGDVFLINHLKDTEVLEEIARVNFNIKSNPYSFSLQRMNVLGSFTGEKTKYGKIGTSYFKARSEVFNKVKASMGESYKPYEEGGLTNGLAGEILELTTDKPRQLLVQSRNKVKGHIEKLTTLKANIQWYKNQVNDYSDLISANELNTNLAKVQKKIDKAVQTLDNEYKLLNENIIGYNRLYNVRHELGRSFGKDVSSKSELIQDVVTLKDVQSIIKKKVNYLDSIELNTITNYSDNYIKAVQGLKNRTKYPKSIEAYEEFIGKHISLKNKVIHTNEEIEYFKSIFPAIKKHKKVNSQYGLNFKDLEDVSKKYGIPYTDLVNWFNHYHKVKTDDINKLILGKKLSTYKNYVEVSKNLKDLQKRKVKLYDRYKNLNDTLKTKYGYDLEIRTVGDDGLRETLKDIETNPDRWKKRPSPNLLLAEIRGVLGIDDLLYSRPSDKTYHGLKIKELEIYDKLHKLHNQILI